MSDDRDDLPEDDYEFEDPDLFPCLICGGDGEVENDDPIQRGSSAYLKCYSCNGSGKRKDMTVW
jgi:hypothetical protein